MPEYDSRTKLEALRDHFEIFSKAANYLMVGNGAGFVGCLTLAKDHPDRMPPELWAVGLLVVMFGAGLLLAALDWSVSMMIKISVTQHIISTKPYSKAWLPWLGRKCLEMLAHIGMWGSATLFSASIILIMSHFTDSLREAIEQVLKLI